MFLLMNFKVQRLVKQIIYDNAYIVHNYAIIIFKSKEEYYAAN